MEEDTLGGFVLNAPEHTTSAIHKYIAHSASEQPVQDSKPVRVSMRPTRSFDTLREEENSQKNTKETCVSHNFEYNDDLKLSDEDDFSGESSKKAAFHALSEPTPVVAPAKIGEEVVEPAVTTHVSPKLKALQNLMRAKSAPKTEGQRLWRLAAQRVRYVTPWLELYFYVRKGVLSTQVLHPTGKGRKYWDLIVLISVMIESIRAPFQLCFLRNVSLFSLFFSLAMDLIYGVHIFVTLRTGFYEKQTGDYICNREKIRENYMSSWFFFDAASMLTLVQVLEIIPLLGGPSENSLKWVLWLETIKLLRFRQWFTMFETYSITNYVYVRPNIMRFLSLSVTAFVLNHWIGCGWMLIGYLQGFGATKWGPSEALIKRPLFSQYIRASFWAGSTMTGNSDESPETDLECFFTLCVIFMGVGFYATIIGNVGSLIQNLDYASTLFREKMESINKFMRSRGFPPSLRERVNDYYTYLWRRQKGMHEMDILEELPFSLRTEIALFKNKDIVQKVPFFSRCEEGLISVIVNMLKAQVCSPGEYILKQGDYGKEMYFMSKGWVEVIVEGKVVTRLGDGSFFGEMALLTSARRKASVRALTYCDLYYLTKDDFNSILEDFPPFAEYIRKTATIRENILAELSKVHKKPTRLVKSSSV